MCGIAGFYHPIKNYEELREHRLNILNQMRQVLSHRGPDGNGVFLSPHFGLVHARLSVIDLENGAQPMFRAIGDKTFGIVYNGEIYNTAELKADLCVKGWQFHTSSDTEVILTGFIEYGPDFVSQLNGIFAFAIMDPVHEALYLYRDRSGVKPLFYAIREKEVIFSSELKGLLSHPDIHPQLDRKGFNEIFSIGPAKTYGCGVFKGIDELLPGHYMRFCSEGITKICYWKLQSCPHEDNYTTTVKKTSELVKNAVRRQMISDVPICTFLSGGVDSSIVSAICAEELKKQGKRLNTFSFDFTGNKENFKASSFQPSQDRPFVEQMVSFLDSDHQYLECSTINQADCLYDSVKAHDLPAMADVDSSMLYFCSQVTKFNKVALTGECADEIFGGYPWFHRKECFDTASFPWTMDLNARKVLLSDDFIDWLGMDDYVQNAYETSIAETPRLAEDTNEEARRREISYLNLKWFMQTLLDRMDRTSMYSGLEARVPFADHRIIEYVWNVPWDMKCKDGVVKNLLRQAGKGLLPDEILFRKKSPYPKTYDTGYEKLLVSCVREILDDSTSPVLPFLDKKKVAQFLNSPSDYGKPWYGQLMAAPQMLAYLIQVNFWMKEYKIELLTDSLLI